MSRFAIVQHQQAQQVHWDFFLQRGDVLQSWKLADVLRPNTAIACWAAPDHRLVYLDYEGPLTADRGHVRRWDWGTYQLQQESPTQIVLAITGKHLRGAVHIERDSPTATQWRLVYFPESP